MTDNTKRSHRDLGRIEFPVEGLTSPDFAQRYRISALDAYHSFGGIQSNRPLLSPGLLRKLSRLIETRVTTNDSDGALFNTANTKSKGVPAGYTYLFQLAAHDAVDTIIPAIPQTQEIGFARNARRRPIFLDTIFGGGPTRCPFAFDLKNGSGRLRLGAVNKKSSEGRKPGPPFRDLPRTNFDPLNGYVPANGLETVLIPDARNDDNLLLAQLTVLFHGLYNHLVECIHNSKPGATRHKEAIAERLIVRIYRRIVREDLLSRILLPDIFKIYLKDGPLSISNPPASGAVSIEFAMAAGRLGHSMVRQEYAMNRNIQLELDQILRISSRHRPKTLPTRHEYLIDWDFFFEPLSGNLPKGFNWALRFGPHVSASLKQDIAAQTPDPQDPDSAPLPGTTFRDLMRETSMSLASVSQLVERILQFSPPGTWGAVLDAVIGSKNQSDIVRAGLASMENLVTYAPNMNLLTEDERMAIVLDPPLSLFLQFEAQQLGEDGSTLGPLGSILIAEAFGSSFDAEPWEIDNAQYDELEVEYLGVCPQSMPALLAGLKQYATHLFEN